MKKGFIITVATSILAIYLLLAFIYGDFLFFLSNMDSIFGRVNLLLGTLLTVCVGVLIGLFYLLISSD